MRFLSCAQNRRTRAQVESLVAAARLDDLRTRLCSRMSFGTAGLRAPMGAGFSRINDLTVIQATQVRTTRRRDLCCASVTSCHTDQLFLFLFPS